jgi:hypothetical protein
MGLPCKSGLSALVKHAPATKVAGDLLVAVGLVEEAEEEAEGVDTRLTVS